MLFGYLFGIAIDIWALALVIKYYKEERDKEA